MVLSPLGPASSWLRQWLRRPARRRRRQVPCPGRALTCEPLEARVLLTGTWTKLTHAAPAGIGTMMLLSDGTVMAEGPGTTNTWYKLTPDATGSYVNGTWSQLASMHSTRLYFGSNVLTDGRVFVVGGEYSSAGSFTRTGEIYNPLNNTWTNIANFPQSQFGDDPTEMLPNGTVLGGYLAGPQTYIYNPTTNAWTQTGTKLHNDRSDEETWVKLDDNSILSYDIFSTQHSQRYLPSSGTWTDAGTVPVALSSSSVGSELGPAFRLPDGRALFLGATGNTAYYTRSTNSWAAGPVIPNSLGADDAPGAELLNGNILCTADHPTFGSPTTVFELNPTTNTYTTVTPPSNIISTSGPAFVGRMLTLPTGQVLYTTGGTGLAVYTPSGSADPAWQPAITSIADNGDGTFTLTGTQLNGISEGASYGDDAEMSSNYPIVRLTTPDTGHVYYARTSNWSSTGVATGSTPVTTQFTLSSNLPAGTYNVEVIASGIASPAVSDTFGVTQLAIDIPADVTAGDQFQATLTAQDANGNTAAGYRGTVQIVTNLNEMLTYTFTSSDQGSHTFTVRRTVAGARTVTATDMANPAISGTADFIVDPAPASQLVVQAPASVRAGTPFDVTVVAEDPYGNTDTNYQGTITWSTTDPGSGVRLPPNYTFGPGDQGHVTFPGGVTLVTPGSWSLTATDISSGINGSATVTVTTDTQAALGTGGSAPAVLPAVSGQTAPASPTGADAVMAPSSAGSSFVMAPPVPNADAIAAVALDPSGSLLSRGLGTDFLMDPLTP